MYLARRGLSCRAEQGSIWGDGGQRVIVIDNDLECDGISEAAWKSVVDAARGAGLTIASIPAACRGAVARRGTSTSKE